MIYFSELANRRVYTQDQVEVGKVSDCIFLATDQPRITKLHIKDKDKNSFLVPIEYFIKINDNVLVQKNYQIVEQVENEISIVKNLLDKQIIDIGGNKVVRVNDVIIQERPFFFVSGVDIGLVGVLRWFKLEKPLFSILRRLRIHWLPQILSWADIQPIELARGRVKLKIKETKLKKVRPEDLADHLEKTNIVNVKRILNILDEQFAAEVIGNLNINFQTALFRHMNPEKAAKIISLVEPDEAVDILLTVNKQKREQILQFISEENKKEIVYLLSLSKTPIGGLITSEYLLADSNLTVSEIISLLKKETKDFSYLSYVYFVNKQQQLVGVCNLHELLLQNPGTPAYRFMTQNVIVIHLTTPEEIALNKLLKYQLYALPVLDDNKFLLGIVTLDNVMDFMAEKLK